MRFRSLLLAAAFTLASTAASAAQIGFVTWSHDSGPTGAGSSFIVHNDSTDIFGSVFIDLYLGASLSSVNPLDFGDIGSYETPQSLEDLSAFLIPGDFDGFRVRLTLNGQERAFGTFLASALLPDSGNPDLQVQDFFLEIADGTTTPVPEPATLTLLVTGIAAGLFRLRRQARTKPAAPTRLLKS